MTKLVADILSAAALAQREGEPTFGMLYLAKQAVELGEPEAARRIADAAIAKDSEAWPAVLATVHVMLGRDDVEDLIAKALQTPSDWLHGELAETYARAGDPARAEAQIALIDEELRYGSLAVIVRLALAAGDLERATKLADPPWARTADPSGLAAMKVELAPAYAARGDATTARQLLEEAEKVDRSGAVVARAKAWVALGDHERARAVAARIDKGRYSSYESLTTAEAYAAAGVTAKVDTILAAYAKQAAESKSASGYAEAAITYLRFGRELGVRKNLKAAEAALAAATDPVLIDSGHRALAMAYVLDKQFAKAIEHIAALGDPEGRAMSLVEVACALREAKTESTPELEAAIGRLNKLWS